jgi:tRNA-guanine family transglycosylase
MYVSCMCRTKISAYVGTPMLPAVLVMDGRDGIGCPATDTCISVETSGGRKRLEPEQLAALATAGEFDVICGPADHALFHSQGAAADRTNKRKAKAKAKSAGGGGAGDGDGGQDRAAVVDGGGSTSAAAAAAAPAAAPVVAVAAESAEEAAARALRAALPAGAPSSSRVSKSVQRTIRWHRELLDAIQAMEMEQAAASAAPPTTTRRPLIFASVVGSVHEEHRTSCAAALCAMTPAFDGYEIGGLQCGESAADRRRALACTIAGLPPTAPRLARASDPLDILDAIAAGVDVIHTRYGSDLSDRGIAITFEVVPNNGDAPAPQEAANQAGSPGPADSASGGKINLRDPRHRLDAVPLATGCDCLACCSSEHTRSYIHHLILTHEILGSTLLGIHNTHRLNAMVREARAAITAGTYAAYTAFIRAQIVPNLQ